MVLCGAGGSDSLAKADVNRPLLDALSGDMVDVDGQQMQLIEVENLDDGYYQGKGNTKFQLRVRSLHRPEAGR